MDEFIEEMPPSKKPKVDINEIIENREEMYEFSIRIEGEMDIIEEQRYMEVRTTSWNVKTEPGGTGKLCKKK